VGVAGEKDADGVRTYGPGFCEQLDTAQSGHLDIGYEHCIRTTIGECIESRVWTNRNVHHIVSLQHPYEAFEDKLIVVDKQDPVVHRSPGAILEKSTSPSSRPPCSPRS